MSNRLPFRYGTRQKFAKVGFIPFAASSVASLELPRVGMMSKLIVQLRGTISTTNGGADTGVLTDEGPWNLLNRLKVNTNIGAASLVDVSGFGAYMFQRLIEQGYSPDKAGVADTTPNADVHVFPLTGNAVAFVLTWIIPISGNDGINFESGLINLQAPETRVSIEATFGAIADPMSNVGAISANLHVGYQYYEIPDTNSFDLPPLSLVRILEENMPIGATGDVVYTVPRMGTLLQLAHAVKLNGARSDSVDSLSIKFNKTDTVYNIERQFARVIERERYSLLPKTGVFYHDFWHAYGDVSTGDTRDAIDSEQLSTLESIVTVTAGATLGANNNNLKAVRRIVQRITQ